MGQKRAVVYREAGDRLQRAQVGCLPLWLLRIAWQRIDACGEVADPLNVVLGEDQFTQGLEVEPAVGRSLDGSIVKVEPVDVNVCTNSVSL